MRWSDSKGMCALFGGCGYLAHKGETCLQAWYRRYGFVHGRWDLGSSEGRRS